MIVESFAVVGPNGVEYEAMGQVDFKLNHPKLWVVAQLPSYKNKTQGRQDQILSEFAQQQEDRWLRVSKHLGGITVESLEPVLAFEVQKLLHPSLAVRGQPKSIKLHISRIHLLGDISAQEARPFFLGLQHPDYVREVICEGEAVEQIAAIMAGNA